MHKISIVTLLLVATAIVSEAYVGQDIYAEPDCSIVTDHRRMFRDISDPTHYWICPEGQEKADYIQCDANHAFMENHQKCVEWENWTWLEPYTNLE